MSMVERKRTMAALCLTAGLILSGTARADPADFDGTWRRATAFCAAPFRA